MGEPIVLARTKMMREIGTGLARIAFHIIAVSGPIVILMWMSNSITPRMTLASPCYKADATLISDATAMTGNGTACSVNNGHPGQYILPGNTYPMHICGPDGSACYTGAYIHTVNTHNVNRMFDIGILYLYCIALVGLWCMWCARFECRCCVISTNYIDDAPPSFESVYNAVHHSRASLVAEDV